MSSSVITSLAINTLIVVLPIFGVHIGSQSLTDAIQTLITMVTGIIIFAKHKQVSDIASANLA